MDNCYQYGGKDSQSSWVNIWLNRENDFDDFEWWVILILPLEDRWVRYLFILFMPIILIRVAVSPRVSIYGYLDYDCSLILCCVSNLNSPVNTAGTCVNPSWFVMSLYVIYFFDSICWRLHGWVSISYLLNILQLYMLRSNEIIVIWSAISLRCSYWPSCLTYNVGCYAKTSWYLWVFVYTSAIYIKTGWESFKVWLRIDDLCRCYDVGPGYGCGQCSIILKTDFLDCERINFVDGESL